MAIQKVIEIVAKVGEAGKEIKSLYDRLLAVELENQKIADSAEEMGDAYVDASKESVKALDKVGDSAKKQSTVIKGLGNSIKIAGTALKSIGIGLVIALVAKLTQVFSENQKVVDAFTNISNTLSIIFTELIGKFIDIVSEIDKATGGFDALGKVIGGAVTAALSNLNISFNAIKLVILEAQLAWEKSFFGDDDPKTIDDLNKRIKQTYINIADGAKTSFEAGKQVINNIGEAAGEIGDAIAITAEKSVKALSEINVKAAYEQGKALTESRKNFELLALQQQRLQLIYQTQAEELRQLRDDDQRSIQDRLKSNEELGKVIQKQFQAEAGTIKQRIASLQQEQNLLGVTVERTNEIYQLQTDLIDVGERLKGVQSEQLQNTNSLLREQRDLIQSVKDAENERAVSQKEFQSGQIEFEKSRLSADAKRLDTESQLDLTISERIKKLQELQDVQDAIDMKEFDRLESEKERILLEKDIAEQEIEQQRQQYALGTQARADAEQAYLDKKLEIDQALIQNKESVETELSNIEQRELEKRLLFQQNVETLRGDIATNTYNLISGLAKKGTTLAKGLAIANVVREQVEGISKIVSNTAVANAKAVALSPATAGQPFVGLNIASASLGIASSVAGAARAIKDITSESKTASSGGE